MALPGNKNFSDYDNYITDSNPTTSAQAQDYFRNQAELLKAVIDCGFWQPETVYQPGDVVKSDSMPNGTEAVMVAVNGGKSSSVEPSWGSVGSANISDGTCFWHLRHRAISVNNIEADNQGNITIPVMRASTNIASGADGLVPAPPATSNELFLSNDGGWKEAGKVKSVNGKTGDVVVDILPVGTIISYAGNTTPKGFLDCNGASLNPATYVNLFNEIGTTYGGDGSTTFNLPNLGSSLVSDVTTGNIPVVGTGKVMGINIGSGYPNATLVYNKSDYRSFVRACGVGAGSNAGSGVSNVAWETVPNENRYVGLSTDSSNSGIVAQMTATKTTVKYCIKY